MRANVMKALARARRALIGPLMQTSPRHKEELLRQSDALQALYQRMKKSMVENDVELAEFAYREHVKALKTVRVHTVYDLHLMHREDLMKLLADKHPEYAVALFAIPLSEHTDRAGRPFKEVKKHG